MRYSLKSVKEKNRARYILQRERVPFYSQFLVILNKEQL